MGEVSEESKALRKRIGHGSNLMKSRARVSDRLKGRTRKAKKTLGQHFLVDRTVLQRIIVAADIAPNEQIIEIGPGRGFLTSALLEKACSVKAIELDDKLAQDLRERFEGQFKLEVVTADARHIPLQRIAGEFDSYKVVANLPYYAASPIIRRFLEAENKPTAMVVLVQKEVAQNMVALPGKMGLLSVATQLYGNPQIVAVIPPSAFKPPPKVTSALVRIDLYSTPLLRLASADSFFELVRAGFSSPRKQIHNGLGHALPLSPKSVISLLKSVHIDIARRPGTLTLEEWGCLHRAWRSLESTPSG